MARALLSSRGGDHTARSLRALRFGSGDRTTRLGAMQFARATYTVDGPATVVVDWTRGSRRVEAYGPGADRVRALVPGMCGDLDPGHTFTDAHPVVLAAQRAHPRLRLSASGSPYHDILPVILGQRITAGEAVRQWARLVDRLGEPAPGPDLGLRLPPRPDRLAETPTWWFHPLGIEAKRAEALRQIGRHGDTVIGSVELGAEGAGAVLRCIRGVGAWTVGSVLAVAFGDPDAIAVGDYHLKNTVVHAFTGRARGSDEEMLALLAPYAGQRGRVVALLHADGHRAPAFGPRQRVLPMSRW